MKSIVISLTFYDDRKMISVVSKKSERKHRGDNYGKQKESLCRY